MQPTALGRRSEDTQVGVFCEQLRRERASRRRKYAPRLPRPKTRPRGAAGQSGSPPRLCVRGTDNKYRVAKDGGPPTGRSATFTVCWVMGARPPPADAWHGVEECRLKVGPALCGLGPSSKSGGLHAHGSARGLYPPGPEARKRRGGGRRVERVSGTGRSQAPSALRATLSLRLCAWPRFPPRQLHGGAKSLKGQPVPGGVGGRVGKRG